MSTEAKRPRMDGGGKKGKTDKRNYYAKAATAGPGSGKKPYLEPGQRGFMVTCNFREDQCVRDSYRLLNEYADAMYGKLEQAKPEEEQKIEGEEEEEEEDISVLVQKQAEAVKNESRTFRFKAVDTGAKNCCFITTTLKDPKELALKILNDLDETRKLKSRNILRLMPIEAVTRANLKDIVDTAGALFDKYFLKEPKKFAIVFNRRFNNQIDREEVINELASLISSKNLHNKANLKNPDLTIIVEVIKGLCLISVVPDYFRLRKYNVVEICAKKDDSTGGEPKAESVTQEKEEADDSKEEKSETGEPEEASQKEEVAQESEESKPVEGENPESKKED